MMKKAISDDFFEISFAQSEANERLKLCDDYKDTYREQHDIDCILSHLTTIDETKKENKVKGGDFKSEIVDFTISYGVNGKMVSEKISVPLGYGHFEKGINHLRDNFSQGLGLNPEERIAANSDECRKRLDNKCKGFKKPTLDMAYLQALGKGTIDTCVETAKALSNEELGAFLKGFQDHSRRVGKKTDDNKEALINALATKLGVDSKELKESIDEYLNKKTKTHIDNVEKDTSEESKETLTKDSAKQDKQSTEKKFSKNPQPSEETKKKMAAKRSETAKTKKAQVADKSKANERAKTNLPLVQEIIR
ncbi:Uncharacterised protein [Helicobacter fennelliae]|uniref:Uncharacterized protein n=1 Tax=Helicobacter fennelliae TaxID=215 RepID=A0A2X3BJF9_9HELI|nr:hypothetical protein [Helicobacter fennelliae]SQB99436.1 Uncharacterised protein [Helicobacter fennelliae]SQB99509.1 Uncharacterised protein [Helicobacter fennelliae]